MNKRRTGMILAFALFTIPIAALLAFTIVSSTVNGAGFARQEQLRSQAFYLADSGIEVAFHLFAANNFMGYTHQPNGSPLSTSDPNLLRNFGIAGLSRQSDGWFEWTWSPGDPVNDSFTHSGRKESYRFQILFPKSMPPGYFLIVSEARVGSRTATHRLEGRVDSALNYTVFDNGDLADFTRSSNEHLTGKVHANGDIYLRPYKTDGLEKSLILYTLTVMEPTNPTLQIFTDGLTSGGNIVRSNDLWNQNDDGGRVQVTNSTTGKSHIMEGAADGAVGKGVAYDSFHPDWTATNSNGAVSRWDGAVADRTLGSKTIAAPNAQTFEPGGYYDQMASTRIDAGTTAPYIKDVTFYNEAEERLVKAKEIDLERMDMTGSWPSNGLIYSDVPVRLVNGQKLPSKLSVASSSTVYIKGDFNKKFPTAAAKSAGTPEQKPVSIMTSDRIYQLTSSFKDHNAPYYPSLLKIAADGGFEPAHDPPLYAGDEDETLEINAALVDGTPTNDVQAWVDDPANPNYIASTGIDNVFLGKLNRKVKQIPSSSAYLKVAFPQSEDYLENLQHIKVRGSGNFTHLRIAHMAKFDNSDASEQITPWVVKSAYVPPDDNIGGEIGLEFLYDPKLAAADGALSAAPFAPRVAHKVRWSY